MLPYLLALALSGSTVETPPIKIGFPFLSMTPEIKFGPMLPKDLLHYLTGAHSVDAELADKFARKMLFSSEGSTLVHKFKMDISLNNPTQRQATRTSVFVYGKKLNDGTVTGGIRKVVSTASVESKIVTTTVKTFWKIFYLGTEVEIEWRPLTSYELQTVHDTIDRSARVAIDIMCNV